MQDGKNTLIDVERIWLQRKEQAEDALEYIKKLKKLEASYRPAPSSAKQSQEPTVTNATAETEELQPQTEFDEAPLFFRSKEGVPVLSNYGLEAVEEINREGFRLVLLLYGFLAIKADHGITGASLLKAARQSGFEIKRADRELADWEDSITTEGERRGKRYILTQAGVNKVETLLAKCLEKQVSVAPDGNDFDRV